jgi:hypothetical protein
VIGRCILTIVRKNKSESVTGIKKSGIVQAVVPPLIEAVAEEHGATLN